MPCKNEFWIASWFALLAAATWACGGALPAGRADEPRIAAELSQSRIYEGDSVRYRITLHNVDPSVEPQLNGFGDFEVRAAGRTSGMQSTIIVNGKLQSMTRGEPSYDYVLTPKRSGMLSIPAPVIEVGGRQYQGPRLQLVVLDPAEQDVVLLELTASRSDVYPLQPFTVKLNVAIKGLPDPFGERDPLSVQQQLPQLTVPWADDEKLPAGVAAREPAAAWLEDYLSAGRNPSGFAINNFRASGARRGLGGFGGFPDIDDLLSDQGFADAGSLFSMFSDDRLAAFRPKPRRTVRVDATGGHVGYWEYSLERVFTTEKLGAMTFGPVTMKGVFATRARTGGEMDGDRIHALAKAITIQVKDAPTADRPDTFTGAIGRFAARAELNPTRVKVGDPLTLTISLEGVGTLDRATAPKLEKLPRIQDEFKVYDATEATSGQVRQFTYSLRPRRAGIPEFPSIPLTYFDVSQEKFVTLNTEPIAMEVAAADPLSDDDIAMASVPSSTAIGLEARTEGIFANITDVTQLADESVRPDRWLFALGGMALSFLAVTVTFSQLERRRGDVVGRRRRGAVRRARQRLEDAREHVAARAARPAADGLSAALTGLVADIVGVEEQGLTSSDVLRYLTELSGESRIVTRLAAVLEHCDAARYGSPAQPLDSLYDEALALFDDMVSDLRGRKRVP